MEQKLVVILGPTASGKSTLAIKLAKKFNGEVVSADSRQVYKGMDIGSGKVTAEEMEGIPHFLLDVASPKRIFTVAQYKKLALKAIYDINKRGKLAILCGGSGFYIQSIINNLSIPEVKPDWRLRKQLEKDTTAELFIRLKKLDPARAKTIDQNNRRRLIRALEIVIKTNKAVPLPSATTSSFAGDILILGIKKDKKELKKLINQRLIKRLEEGMIEEVEKLKASGISWQRLEEFGLEYRYVAQYLQNQITYNEMITTLQKEIERFAKRQMTWFNHQVDRPNKKRIHWIKNTQEAEKLLKKFIKKKSEN